MTAIVGSNLAAMDVEQIMRSRHYRLYDVAFKGDPGYWRKASPTQQNDLLRK